MDNLEYKNAKAFNIIDTVGYLSNSIINKSILRKTTGSISAVSFDAGEVQVGKKSPYDILIQIIEGKAEVIIEGTSNLLEMGQAILIPANSSNTVKANVRFKMISTIIKSGYEEVTL